MIYNFSSAVFFTKLLSLVFFIYSMENANSWYFTKEQLASTPSRRCGIDANKELSYRQQAANFIQDMGQRLQVSQLCINTAIVYMHRFYVFHSFMDIHRYNLSVAALFLAAKFEEQPRKLEHVIKVAHVCLHKDAPPLDVRSEAYANTHFEVVTNESILLQTLGFVLGIEHPHTYVVKLCQMVKACKDLAQTSYFMATTSLHMTTMCLQYKPTIVAAVCIHLACKWSSWKLEPCSEGKEWYYYVDKSVTLEQLESLTQDFISILETSPHRFKRKIMPHKQEAGGHVSKNASDESKCNSSEGKTLIVRKDVSSPGPSTSSSSSSSLNMSAEKPLITMKVENVVEKPQPVPSPPKKMKASSHSISIDAYREKKEKERMEQKSAPPPPPSLPASVEQSSSLTKPQHALVNDLARIHKHHASSNSMEPHSAKEKSSVKAAVTSRGHHSAPPVPKVNHLYPKKSELPHSSSKEAGNNPHSLKIPPSLSSDPVVVLERVDVKPKIHAAQNTDIPQTSSSNKVANDYVPTDSDSKELFTPAISVATKSKHHKHKTNSLRNNHNSVVHPHKQSPDNNNVVKATNGSKETNPNERRNSAVEITGEAPETMTSKCEKHKTKHSSYNSSKERVANSESSSNPRIKVKIRKEVINKLPEKTPKGGESPKKSLKIKLPKPPVQEPIKAIKLVITEDKSGSGSYCTSHKNERESSSRKRAHSPGGSREMNPNKYARVDHHGGSSTKQSSKTRHSSSRSNAVAMDTHKQSNDYHGVVDIENYANPPFYESKQFFSYHQQVPPLPLQPPPPPPSSPLPPPDSAPSGGYRGKMNYNHYLSTQPPPPPSE